MLRTALTDLLGIQVPVVGAPMARKRSDYDIASINAGQGAGLITEDRPAAELVASLAAGAERLLRSWG